MTGVQTCALPIWCGARRPARTAPSGDLVTLADQDRTLWNQELIREGHDLVRRCLRRNQPGPYQLQAAVNAVHTDGTSTDWSQVLALYDQLMAQMPTPVVALNRAVAVAEVHGPALALAAIEHLNLPGYHLLPATRADFLARLGRIDEARAAYDEAIGLSTNDTERDFLQGRRDGLTG